MQAKKKMMKNLMTEKEESKGELQVVTVDFEMRKSFQNFSVAGNFLNCF